MTLSRFFRIFIFILFTSPAVVAQQQDKIVIYSDDFVGAALDLGVGRYDFMTLTRGGVSVVRSVKIPSGMQVTLYDRDNFEGTALVLTSNASMSFLSSKGFGKVTQNVSLVVEYSKQPVVGPAVTIFRDNFSGVSLRLGTGFYDHADLAPVGNDQLSSLRIPKGLQVTLYEHGNSGGRKLVLTADTGIDALKKSKFDNFTSSILIEQLPEPEETPKEEEKTEPKENPAEQPQEEKQPAPDQKFNEDPLSPTVVVYQGEMNGKARQFGPGSYDTGSLDVGDNEISSVRVMDGIRITLYDLPGFKGKSLVLEQDAGTSFLEAKGFNNQASSIRVELIPRITFFDDNFSGPYVALEPGYYNINEMKIGNDQVSSVRSTNGAWTIFFEDSNFKGQSLLLTKDASADFLEGRNFNNAMSSVVVGSQEDALPVATIYVDDVSGRQKQLTPGNYPVLDFDDQVSSVDFPRGLRVTLFENPNYQGASITLFAKTDLTTLNKYGFNDMASSAKIEWIHPRELVVTVFDGSFDGQAQALTPGRYRAKDIRFGDKKVSSIKVPDRMRATLFDQDNFQGLSLTLERDKDFTGIRMFDNIYSSFVIEDITTPFVSGKTAATTSPVPTPEPQPVVVEEVQTITMAACEMTVGEFETAVKSIESKPFSGDRLEMARLVTKEKCLDNEQIRRIAVLFGFEEHTMAFVKEAYPLARERSTYYTLENVFKFMSSREEFLKFVGSR